MEKNEIQKLMEEVEIYKQAIRDAQDALDAAEKELDEVLEYEYEQENSPKLTIVE